MKVLVSVQFSQRAEETVGRSTAIFWKAALAVVPKKRSPVFPKLMRFRIMLAKKDPVQHVDSCDNDERS